VDGDDEGDEDGAGDGLPRLHAFNSRTGPMCAAGGASCMAHTAGRAHACMHAPRMVPACSPDGEACAWRADRMTWSSRPSSACRTLSARTRTTSSPG
jgi:hypothetical protein